MVLFCFVPWISSFFAHQTKNLFLLGIGAMVGICFFDLLPEIFEIGGITSLIVMAIVWAAYALLHTKYFGEHGHNHSHKTSASDHERHGFFLFMASMIAHCFSSGALLVVSEDLSPLIAKSVFYALIIHKALEAFSVSAFITQHHMARLRKGFAFAAYLLSVPAGVFATLFFSAMITTKIALILSDVAAGTLAGCLLYDFLIPNLKDASDRKRRVAWMSAGLFIMLVGLRGI